MSRKLSTQVSIALLVLTASFPSTGHSQSVRKKETANNASSPTEYPEMVLIPAGKFKMGSPKSERDRNEWEKQKELSVAEFYLGKYEVTFSQYKKFAEATGFKTERERDNDKSTWRNPTANKWTQGPKHPALCIDWQGASEYCKWLSKATGESYRLPTEVEWEYACRARTTTAFNVGKQLTTKDANFRNYNGSMEGIALLSAIPLGTKPVGSYKPNAFGLYDMHGNAFEWCSDLSVNEGYEASRGYHIIRGGSWNMSEASYCRSAYREPFEGGNEMMGFRVAKD